MSAAQERFRNMQLQEEFDSHDPKENSLLLPYSRASSGITEIVAACDIIFALSHSGVCAAFSRVTNRRICFLNGSPDEVIRSLFYNQDNESLITVSVYGSENLSALRCRTTQIEYIQQGKQDAGFPLFEESSLKWLEFDDVNGKILTYSHQDSIYKVFNMKNYTLLYSICDKNIRDIKISQGVILLIYPITSNTIPLRILSIEDGTVLNSFNHLLNRNRKVDFIELFNEKLLVKQEEEDLQILDIRNFHLTQISRTEFMTPSAFIFLNELQLFATFNKRSLAVWNMRGELVTSFQDYPLWQSDCNTNNIYKTSEHLIISYCKADSNDSSSEGGSINITNILTGKCLAKITVGDLCKQKKTWKFQSKVSEILKDITALYYDEKRHEIYTGNRQGLVHVWAN